MLQGAREQVVLLRETARFFWPSRRSRRPGLGVTQNDIVLLRLRASLGQLIAYLPLSRVPSPCHAGTLGTDARR